MNSLAITMQKTELKGDTAPLIIHNVATCVYRWCDCQGSHLGKHR